jgi:hypothetical protein
MYKISQREFAESSMFDWHRCIDEHQQRRPIASDSSTETYTLQAVSKLVTEAVELLDTANL